MRGLRKVFGATVAVDGIDLDVPVGSVLGMLGPNGSGKTTLIRMLLGLTPPTAGTVELLGHARSGGRAAARRRARRGARVPRLPVRPRQPAARPRRPSRCWRRATSPATVGTALERVGLAAAADRRYRGYSLGMKQRLGLAAALLVPRRLVVLDEPTNGLDPAGTRDVRRIIGELHADGATVIVSSHLLAEVEATCTHVAVLQAGTLVASGRAGHAAVGRVAAGSSSTTPDVELALRTLREVATAYRGDAAGERGGRRRAARAGGRRAAGAGGVAVHEARRSRTNLEDLFARLTEEP